MAIEAKGIASASLAEASKAVTAMLGLHFPPERHADLERGLRYAAAEFGFGHAAECVEWLLSGPPTDRQAEILATHLTVGETYFFRDRNQFAALANHVVPALVAARRSDRRQRLRLWSAGCCTGEEAYSLAILLRQLVPDLEHWQVTILATDINRGFLRKAGAGVYGEWSFRDAPAGLRERWFRPVAPGRYAISPAIRSMVTFAHLNLAADASPSALVGTDAMDLILCRNVLMYFAPEQTVRTIASFRRALAGDGWLGVSASEASPELFGQFSARNFPGAILFENNASAAPAGFPPAAANHAGWSASLLEADRSDFPGVGETVPASPEVFAPASPASDTALERAERAYARGHFAAAADTLLDQGASEAKSFSLLARALANQGRLAEALTWCERWLRAEKLEPAAHYLRAIILLEQGREGDARVSLQRATYLEPAFVPAHFALGSQARAQGRLADAGRHFASALQGLARLGPEDALPECDGLTAGRLRETIETLLSAEAAR